MIAGQQGVEATYTASWSSLEADATYLGLVTYGETGASTVVTVDTGVVPTP